MDNKSKALQSKRDYDILNMLNSISNFEIFTPFEVAQNMVNLLPEDVFKDPSYKFLDPCVKSGIFLREIIYKLNDNLPLIKYTDPYSGITYDLSDKKERISHILRNMIYGIAISELTAYVSRRTLYGVMDANVDKELEFLNSKLLSKKQDINSDDLHFNDYYDYKIFNTKDRNGYEKEGNIFYPNDETNIDNEDTHYPFINETEHKFINLIKEGKVKFNIIIGNPPYQQNDGGNESSAKPIYQHFINNGLNLKPKHICMIIPSRWMLGGKGLDKFRKQMFLDKKIKKIVDFFNEKDCFPGVTVEGGVCYFIRSEDNSDGICEFTNIINGESITIKRKLWNETIFLRDNNSFNIIKKINFENNLSNIVMSRNTFGFLTNFKDFNKIYINDYIKIFLKENKKTIEGYIDKNKIEKNKDLIYKYKVVTGKAYGGAGKVPNNVFSKPFILKPNEICSESFLVLGIYNSEEEAIKYVNLLKTKFVRFLVFLLRISNTVKKDNFKLVPFLETSIDWNDEKLYSYFNLSKEEIEYIEKTIKPME